MKLFEALQRSEELINSYSDWCELVGSIRRRHGRQYGIRASVRQCELDSTGWRTGCVRHSPQDRAAVDLGIQRNGARQHEGSC
jgi:hypothetical protein